MKKYDFYQNLNARRTAVITMTAITVGTLVFWYFLWQQICALPVFPRFMMIGIWVIGVLMFSHSSLPYIRTGGRWLIYICDRVLHVEFPVCEKERSFEINIDDIVEIQENYSRTWEGGKSGNIRPTILLLTGPKDGHVLPEPHEIKMNSLLKALKSLRPDLPHKINGKRINGQ